jgi:predicted DNA-binding ArsR family transcriptional regulator
MNVETINKIIVIGSLTASKILKFMEEIDVDIDADTAIMANIRRERNKDQSVISNALFLMPNHQHLKT